MTADEEHREEHEALETGGGEPVEDRPVPRDVLDTVREGLDPGGAPTRVVVIGAGVAGLVAAFELDRAGHDVVVLEAQNRVGGRIYTCRDFAPGLYAEFGAMRIPRAHDLTLAYCDLFR
ncbi:MAG: flavin monoamine oxidase family protein, partial [Actinomycetota bacterium]